VNFINGTSKNIPFLAWECITLFLPNKEISLVIKNEKNMERLIKLLIYSIKTVNGVKNSQEKFFNYLYK
jgi:hypothetical protein